MAMRVERMKEEARPSTSRAKRERPMKRISDSHYLAIPKSRSWTDNTRYIKKREGSRPHRRVRHLVTSRAEQ